jgi:ubiquinone/menaquinone biosynthesis C-methylase UbiE
MTRNKLGLPLEYKKHPEFFDASNVNETTDAKNSVIEKLLKKHGVKTVLDLTCGTGSQVLFLAKRGYQVTGSDFSESLLKIAKGKAKKEKLKVKFIEGDMRKIKAGKFDAVITIFNAVGHLTKSDFEKAMRNVAANLKPGGIYVFDIFNFDAMSDEAVSKLSMYVHRKINDLQVHHVQCSTLDRGSGILTSYDEYVIQKKAGKPERFSNKFSLQIYGVGELREMLERNGFEVLEQLAMDGKKFLKNKSLSVLTVGRRK